MKKENTKLDKPDYRLLYELKLNSRQSINELARSVRQSPQALHYRLNRLIRQGVISSFFTIVDFSKLGYQSFEVSFRLDAKPEEKKKLIQFLVNHPSVTLVETLYGRYDLLITIMARNLQDFQGVLLQITDSFSPVISDFFSTVALGFYYYPRTYLIEENPTDRKPIIYGVSKEIIPADSSDQKLLQLLSADARIPTVKLAQQTGLSVDTIRSRLSKLKKAGVIAVHTISLNLPLANYELLIKLREPTTQKLARLESYCRLNPYISFFIPLSGQFNAVVIFDAKDSPHFYSMVDDLRERVGGIADFEAFMVGETPKWRTMPEG